MTITRLEFGLTIELLSEQETERLGHALAEVLAPGTVIGLVGPLGAGKTRLARAIAESFGVDPAVIASPTFVLIHEYEGTLPVYHFDAYRLDSARAFEDLGVADYWNAEGFVSWSGLTGCAGSCPLRHGLSRSSRSMSPADMSLSCFPPSPQPRSISWRPACLFLLVASPFDDSFQAI